MKITINKNGKKFEINESQMPAIGTHKSIQQEMSELHQKIRNETFDYDSQSFNIHNPIFDEITLSMTWGILDYPAYIQTTTGQQAEFQTPGSLVELIKARQNKIADLFAKRAEQEAVIVGKQTLLSTLKNMYKLMLSR